MTTEQFERYKKGEYGFTRLSKLVDDFCIEMFDDGKRFFLNYFKIGKIVWNKLFYTDLKAFKDTYLLVDKSTNTARLPPNYKKWYALSVVDDCNNKQFLSYNEYFVTAEKPKNNKCGCKKCSCSSELCGDMAGVNIAYEDVVYNNTTYQKVIKTKVCETGDIVEEIYEPLLTKNAEGDDEIVFKTTRRHVATLDTSPCGCILDTPENKLKCVSACGHKITCCRKECKTPTYTGGDNAGKFKIDEDHGVIWLMNCTADKVLLTHSCNGTDNCGDTLIPDWAAEAVKAGMYYKGNRYRKGVPISDKQYAKSNYDHEVMEMFTFLWPIIPHEQIDTQDIMHLW